MRIFRITGFTTDRTTQTAFLRGVTDIPPPLPIFRSFDSSFSLETLWMVLRSLLLKAARNYGQKSNNKRNALWVRSQNKKEQHIIARLFRLIIEDNLFMGLEDVI